MLIAKYSDNLKEIESLKQEILGQENKIEEMKKQIVNFANSIVENTNKINKLEDA